MGRIVERLILTKDNRVRDRGTLNRFVVGALDLAVGTFTDGISGLHTAGSPFGARCVAQAALSQQD
jgi:hypothetical protein